MVFACYLIAAIFAVRLEFVHVLTLYLELECDDNADINISYKIRSSRIAEPTTSNYCMALIKFNCAAQWFIRDFRLKVQNIDLKFNLSKDIKKDLF